LAKKVTEIIWTEPAKKDLRSIYDFLSNVSEPIAFRIVTKIVDRVDILKTGFNKIGQAEPLLKHKKNNYRYLVEGNYKIIYFMKNDTIVISTVFDARQNPQLLKKKIKDK
jgi:toxin ParE1/3/4